MKISEKNVLVAIGILFVIVATMLNFGDKETTEQLEKQPNIEIISSPYYMITLEFDK